VQNITKRISLVLCIVSLLQVAAVADIYVTTNGGGIFDGSSWDNAFDNIQTAINNAGNGDNIYIAQGTYATTGQLQ
jgi:hypothetical protein